MPQRTVNMGTDEPEQRNFELPSEQEHLFQVVDIIDNPDPDVVVTKLEVAEGDELGRSLLHRVSLDSEWKGFFLTRLFLKACGEPHKGDGVVIDSDNWIGRQFRASVVHNEASNGKVYANIDQYAFDKPVEQAQTAQIAGTPVDRTDKDGNPIAWDT